MRLGYYWPIYGDQHELAFPYATSRAHRHAVEILGEYCGTLIREDYAAYAAYAQERDAVMRASCWAHVHRKFVDAEDVEPERAARALEFIRGLYEIEEEIRDQSLEGEKKLAMRAERTRPVAWLTGYVEETVKATEDAATSIAVWPFYTLLAFMLVVVRAWIL